MRFPGNSPHHGGAFSTGDCARLFFTPNTDGYVYVVNVDAANKVNPLFPQAHEGNFRRAGEVADMGVQFVDAPSFERIFVLFSRDSIQNAPALTLTLAARKSAGQAHEGVWVAGGNRQPSTAKRMRRDRESVSASRPDAATYVVVADPELALQPVIVMAIDLVHVSR